jgi:hypothetical protein
MRTTSFTAAFLSLLLISCGREPDTETGQASAGKITDTLLSDHPVRERLADAKTALLDFNIIQRTCALYVAVRASAWEETIAFGRDIDDSMVRWNVCPGGTMVACAVAPTGNGDTVITGIPWSNDAITGH